MQAIRTLCVSLSFAIISTGVSASMVLPENGPDFRTLDKAQPVTSGKKIEVIEFFWYACSHCHAFDPALEKWVTKQGDRIAFKRIPIAFRDTFVPQQKMFYALESIGGLAGMHSRIFQAIHVDRKKLESEDNIIDFVKNAGVSKQKFTEAYQSFGVQTKVMQASQIQQNYRVDGVPMIAIDGLYITSPSIAGAKMGNQPETALHERTLKIMDFLVDKAEKNRQNRAPVEISISQTKTANAGQSSAK